MIYARSSSKNRATFVEFSDLLTSLNRSTCLSEGFETTNRFFFLFFVLFLGVFLNKSLGKKQVNLGCNDGLNIIGTMESIVCYIR